jgi:nicotinate-nucleotide adenylyltransferase
VTRRLGILGGTFDPIHVGHLDAAGAARSALSLDDVLFLPAHGSPLRTAEPHASAFHRFAMVALAIDDVSSYRVSDAELVRQGRSYTIDTLRSFHAEGWRPGQLFFILGADAFADISAWHAFPAVLDAAHFVVIARPGVTIETALASTPDLHARTSTPSSAVVDDTRIFLVHAQTRDVSSTSIRRRMRAGEPIDGLVPAPVARHIAAHRLYQTDNDLHGHD